MPATLYTYPLKPVKGDQLAAEIIAAGLPPSIVSVSPSALEIVTPEPLSVEQKAVLDAVVAAHVPTLPRRLRDFWDVYQQIKGLSGGTNPPADSQKGRIWIAITQTVPGSDPPRPVWATVKDRVAANSMAALHWSANNSGAAAAALTDARERLVAMMLSDPQFINYLVQPAFDPSINVPGDEVVP